MCRRSRNRACPVSTSTCGSASTGRPGCRRPCWRKLNGELNKVLQHPELKAAFAKIGIEPRGTTPEEGAAFTRSEYEKWKKVIVEGKIAPG